MDKCMCSSGEVTLGGTEGGVISQEMLPPSLAIGHSRGAAALPIRIYDHKPITAEFRAEHHFRGLSVFRCYCLGVSQQ